MNRVVVTGMAGVTSLGSDWPTFSDALKNGRSGIRAMPEWAKYKGLDTQVAGPVDDFVMPSHYPRKKVRGMGQLSRFAARATELALTDAGLLDDPVISGGQCGIAYGSSAGSPDAACEFATMLNKHDLTQITATTYVRMMSHTTAVNLSIFFGVRGRVYTTSSACTSGSQGIGYAYEAIKNGTQTVMIAGGAEQLCPTEAAVFDTFGAASVKNATPNATPSPFDAGRDGLVIGEGAGTLILESLEHAAARGATIYAELIGFATNADGAHITQPDADSMQAAMMLALADANCSPESISYISAHGTATPWGDVAESLATARVFDRTVPVSSLKGHLGHTLGACGAIEAWASIAMMRERWLAPTLNLVQVDPQCAELDYIIGAPRATDGDLLMSNNFAFGGINTSLIFRIHPA